MDRQFERACLSDRLSRAPSVQAISPGSMPRARQNKQTNVGTDYSFRHLGMRLLALHANWHRKITLSTGLHMTTVFSVTG